MKHKLLRGLVAVVLVCCLVVSWSPIRVKAMMPVVGWDGFAWNLADIIASGAIGIGLSPGSVPDDWNQMISDAKQACQKAFGLTGDMFKIYSFFNGSGYTYYAKADFVEWLRDWLWDSSALSTDLSYPYDDFGGYSDKFHERYLLCQADPYYFLGYNEHLDRWLCGSSTVSPFVFTYSYTNPSTGLDVYGVRLQSGGTLKYMVMFPDGRTTSTSNTGFDGLTWYSSSACGETTVVTDRDFSLGRVALPELTFGDGYPEWVQNSATIPAGTFAEIETDTAVLPVGLGQTQVETEGLTQEQIWAGESTLKVEIQETLEGTVSGTAWADFTTWFGQKLEWIPKQILEGITAIFVPKEDFLTAKWEAIRAEFAFADSIMTSGDMILGVLNGLDPEPPVIYVDLGDAEGSYYLGGQVAFLDLRWYERYKSTGDAIISAFLWLVFVWRMFIKLPGIIGGLPGDFVMQGVTDLGLADRLPARKKEYENQRQENRRFFKK